MKKLTLQDMLIVIGGVGDSDTLSKNARIAVVTCGVGNVKSVSLSGFVCK